MSLFPASKKEFGYLTDVFQNVSKEMGCASCKAISLPLKTIRYCRPP
jgi:hypothetical protein